MEATTMKAMTDQMTTLCHGLAMRRRRKKPTDDLEVAVAVMANVCATIRQKLVFAMPAGSRSSRPYPYRHAMVPKAEYRIIKT